MECHRTIGTFCSDFVVRECLHSLFATALFFLFSEENRTLIETAPSLFVDTSLTNGTGLCTKIQPYGTHISRANDMRPHEMRVQNGATISPGADSGGGRWGARPSLGRSFTIQNALFNSIFSSAASQTADGGFGDNAILYRNTPAAKCR